MSCQFIGFLPFVVLFVIFPFRKVCHLTKIWNCPNPLRCAEPLERGASPTAPSPGALSPLLCSYVLSVFGFLPFVVLFVIFPFKKLYHLTKIWNCPNPLRCAEPPERGASPTAPSPGALSPLRCSYVLSVYRILPFVVSYFFIPPKGRMLIRHSESRLLTGP